MTGQLMVGSMEIAALYSTRAQDVVKLVTALAFAAPATIAFVVPLVDDRTKAHSTISLPNGMLHSVRCRQDGDVGQNEL